MAKVQIRLAKAAMEKAGDREMKARTATVIA